MSEANLSGGGGGVPIGSIVMLPSSADLDYSVDGMRFLRTGLIETDLAKFDANAFKSNIGANWQRVGSFTPSNGIFATDMQSNGNTIVATMSQFSGQIPQLYRSTDNGVTWAGTNTSTASLDGRCWQAIDYGNGRFVVVGQGGHIGTSSDAFASWQLRTSPTTANLRDVFWNGSLFVAVGDGVVVTSPDGVTWTLRTVPAGLAGQPLFSVAFGNGIWVVASATNAVMTSPDGITWTARAVVNGSAASAVIFDTDINRFVILGSFNGTNAQMGTSADGINWTFVNPLFPVFMDAYHPHFGKIGGFYVATSGVTNNNQIVRTRDLITSSSVIPQLETLNGLRWCKTLRNGSTFAVESVANKTNILRANNAAFAGHINNIVTGTPAQMVAYVRIS